MYQEEEIFSQFLYNTCLDSFSSGTHFHICLFFLQKCHIFYTYMARHPCRRHSLSNYSVYKGASMMNEGINIMCWWRIRWMKLLISLAHFILWGVIIRYRPLGRQGNKTAINKEIGVRASNCLLVGCVLVLVGSFFCLSSLFPKDTGWMERSF